MLMQFLNFYFIFFIKQVRSHPKNTILNKNTTKSLSKYESKLETTIELAYHYKHEIKRKLIFSTVVKDCITKNNYPQSSEYCGTGINSSFRFYINFEKVKRKKLCNDESEGIAERSNVFAFINEKTNVFISKDKVAEILEKGKGVFINIGNFSNINYLVVPIYIRPEKIYINNEEVVFNNQGFGYTLLFEELFDRNFLKLNSEEYQHCVKNLEDLCKLTQERFNHIFRDKIFLLANKNLEHYKVIFRFLKNLEYQKKDSFTLIKEILDKIYKFAKDLTLSKYYPNKKTNRLHPYNQDTFTTAVCYGIMTDIINIIRHYINPELKFNFYEIFESFIEVHMAAVISVTIKYDNIKKLKIEDVTIESETNDKIEKFYHIKWEKGLELNIPYSDLKDKNYSSIRVRFKHKRKTITSEFMKLPTIPLDEN
ncbi:putative SP-containing protein [Vairimorpha necatrix]|uniref:SP-containing protein n=1 Tax=Vairimorpha necatrix TaxID=6039 RepID=A0AAX4JAC9_9MICR